MRYRTREDIYANRMDVAPLEQDVRHDCSRILYEAAMEYHNLRHISSQISTIVDPYDREYTITVMVDALRRKSCSNDDDAVRLSEQQWDQLESDFRRIINKAFTEQVEDSLNTTEAALTTPDVSTAQSSISASHTQAQFLLSLIMNQEQRLRQVEEKMCKSRSTKPVMGAPTLDFVIATEQASSILDTIRTYIVGKSLPKDMMMPVRAAMDAGVIRKPHLDELTSALPAYGAVSKSSFNRWLAISSVGHPYQDSAAFQTMVGAFESLRE